MLPPDDREPPLEREAPEELLDDPELREAPELLPEETLDPDEALDPDEDPDRGEDIRDELPLPRARLILPRKEPDLEAPLSPPTFARVMLGEEGKP
jgi:hypothetical protein